MSQELENLVRALSSEVMEAKGDDDIPIYITAGDAKRILQAIITLEPKAVYDMRVIDGRTTGYCPNCDRTLYRTQRDLFRNQTNFCPGCGQKVIWEG